MAERVLAARAGRDRENAASGERSSGRSPPGGRKATTLGGGACPARTVPDACHPPRPERKDLAGGRRNAGTARRNRPLPVEPRHADLTGTPGKRVAKVKDSLEDKLKAVSGPDMPPEVEARIRQRLTAEALHPLPAK